VGLILFGDKAYLQSPLTLDVKTVNKLLQESRVGFAGRSTAIGDAIGLGIKRLNNASNTDAVLLLLTDGADTSSFIPPRKAADIAAKNNIKIYTIGVAPSKNAGSLGSFFGLSSGSDLDEGLLKYIADKTKAKYFKATSLGQLDDIYSTIDNLEKINRNYLNIYPQISLYYYPLALALIIVFVYLSFYFARRFFYKK
jgi:Ca-activated chloride channel family protein